MSRSARLDPEVVQRLRGHVAAKGGFDVVHWWGALYHTGNMRLAIERAASLVRPRGALVIAIYIRHWSSPAWLMIKYAYCKSPKAVQRLLEWALVPVVYVANWLVTKQEPRKQARGMDFFYDVVDWVGGYPYEYAYREEIMALIELLGFRCVKLVPSQVQTGCIEFVFQHVN